jgi:hypothetical protein
MRLTRRGFMATVAALPLSPAPARQARSVHVFVKPARLASSAIPNRSQVESLVTVLCKPGTRPDLVVINGIGYGKDDPLPPPFGSGA